MSNQIGLREKSSIIIEIIYIVDCATRGGIGQREKKKGNRFYYFKVG